jgi:hypothetical protein
MLQRSTPAFFKGQEPTVCVWLQTRHCSTFGYGLPCGMRAFAEGEGIGADLTVARENVLAAKFELASARCIFKGMILTNGLGLL